MPAYSYKERFVPMLLDGTKPFTIRQRRRHPAKPGDTLYMYYGLRTKWCRKLFEATCTGVKTIVITRKGSVFLFSNRISDAEYEDLIQERSISFFTLIGNSYRTLSKTQKNALAWRDGFRADGSSQDNSEGSFDLMIRFWRKTHPLPFVGDIIFWQPVNWALNFLEEGPKSTVTSLLQTVTTLSTNKL